MNALEKSPAEIAEARTRAVLGLLRLRYEGQVAAHGAHHKNYLNMVRLAGAVAGNIGWTKFALRDDLANIAVLAMRWLPWSWDTVCDRIVKERARQEELLAAGKFDFNCATQHMGDLFKLPVLSEEIGEVGEAILEHNVVNLSTELVQVAAVCVAWIEALEGQPE